MRALIAKAACLSSVSTSDREDRRDESDGMRSEMFFTREAISFDLFRSFLAKYSISSYELELKFDDKDI